MWRTALRRAHTVPATCSDQQVSSGRKSSRFFQHLSEKRHDPGTRYELPFTCGGGALRSAREGRAVDGCPSAIAHTYTLCCSQSSRATRWLFVGRCYNYWKPNGGAQSRLPQGYLTAALSSCRGQEQTAAMNCFRGVGKAVWTTDRSCHWDGSRSILPVPATGVAWCALRLSTVPGSTPGPRQLRKFEGWETDEISMFFIAVMLSSMTALQA